MRWVSSFSRVARGPLGSSPRTTGGPQTTGWKPLDYTTEVSVKSLSVTTVCICWIGGAKYFNHRANLISTLSVQKKHAHNWPWPYPSSARKEYKGIPFRYWEVCSFSTDVTSGHCRLTLALRLWMSDDVSSLPIVHLTCCCSSRLLTPRLCAHIWFVYTHGRPCV